MRAVLQNVATNRKQGNKQLLVVESEQLAYSLHRHLCKQGLSVIDIPVNPSATSATEFLQASSVARFNAASPTTIALVCLSHVCTALTEKTANTTTPAAQDGIPLSTIPRVDLVMIAEKIVLPSSISLYHNLLVTLIHPMNASMQIIEMLSETEARLNMQVSRGNASIDSTVKGCVKNLLALTSTKKEKRGEKPLVCEIVDECYWKELEEKQVTCDFLFPTNERRFMSVRTHALSNRIHYYHRAI